jgi:indolepyruvate ferredoxin oxidoreductase
MERRLIAEYERAIATILADLAPGNHATAVEIASVPEHIRGFGHVKLRHLADAKRREAALLARFAPEGAAAVPTTRLEPGRNERVGNG